jgi:hypothetical protein
LEGSSDKDCCWLDEPCALHKALHRVTHLEAALKAICTTNDQGYWIEVYRAAGGGYQGLQAIAEKALDDADSGVNRDPDGPFPDPLRYVAEIVLNKDGLYGNQILALTDFLAGEFADEQLGRDLAAKGFWT